MRPDHLLTRVDLVDPADLGGAGAVLSLVLDTGAETVLLDGRGWGSTRTAVHEDGSRTSEPGLPGTPVGEVADLARMVVGPDEPFGEHTHESMADEHWATLADTAQAAGIDVDGPTLARLRHDVELSARLRAILA